MGRPKLRTADVRDEVVRCALDALEQAGPMAVSARRVASSAGTSTAAIYEFFGDKSGLVRAVYLEGFVALGAELETVHADADDDPRRALVALLDAARRFAHERPMLFELMYSRPFAEFAPGPGDLATGVAVYRTIVAAVRRWLVAVGSSVPPKEAAQVIVAAHRGFVMGELAGIAGSTEATVEARYRRGVAAVLDGLVARGVTVTAGAGEGDFVPFGHPSPMLDHLGDLRRHAKDAGRFGFLVDEPKLNGRRVLHAGAVSTIADVVIGHALAAATDPPARYVTTSLEVHYVGAGQEGDWIDVTVTPVRIGRRLAVGFATFAVAGRPVGFATASFMPPA